LSVLVDGLPHLMEGGGNAASHVGLDAPAIPLKLVDHDLRD